ncbi:MAG: hypothetical protein LBU32_29205 [Clostridiales bacterium]|nr:hypothetical protein [Clostridiales bacterium]
MESLGVAAKGELSRQAGTGASSVEDIASQYSERMKSDIISGKSALLSMDGLYASKNIGIIGC